MSADKPATDAPVPKAGKKKLVIIIAAVLVLVLAGGGGAVFYLKGKAAKAAAEAAEADGEDAPKKEAHGGGGHDGHAPTFLPLDPFVVNLADKDADRYVQIGITLEVESSAFAEQMKGYMPAVRNVILLIIAGKTSRDLLDRTGKEDLAEEIQREAVRPMGIDIPKPAPKKVAVAGADGKGEQDEVPAHGEKPAKAEKSDKADKADKAEKAHGEDADDSEKPAKKKKKAVSNPITHVNFSSFIIQ